MEEQGVKLYAEADTFDNVAGTLLSHLTLRNTSEKHSVVTSYKAVVQMASEYMVRKCKDYPDGPPGSEIRQRRNRTISVIRRLSKKYRKKVERIKVPWN